MNYKVKFERYSDVGEALEVGEGGVVRAETSVWTDGDGNEGAASSSHVLRATVLHHVTIFAIPTTHRNSVFST